MIRECCAYCKEPIEDEEEIYDLTEECVGLLHEDCGFDWLAEHKRIYVAERDWEIRG